MWQLNYSMSKPWEINEQPISIWNECFNRISLNQGVQDNVPYQSSLYLYYAHPHNHFENFVGFYIVWSPLYAIFKQEFIFFTNIYLQWKVLFSTWVIYWTLYSDLFFPLTALECAGFGNFKKLLWIFHLFFFLKCENIVVWLFINFSSLYAPLCTIIIFSF